MWLIYVLVGLALLIGGGIYAWRRIAGALAQVGLAERWIRRARWACTWLVFGFPIVMVTLLVITLISGRPSMIRPDGVVAVWLLDYPFVWALLVLVQALPWLLVAELVRVIVKKQRGVAAAARVHTIAVLGAVGLFTLYTPIRLLAERGEVRIRHHAIAAAAPATQTPFRIAFLADVQQAVYPDGARIAELFDDINATAPDVVLSGGDWIDSGPDHIAGAAASAARLKSRLGTYSVRGDHEHFAYFDRERSVTEVESAMREHGIHMVSDDLRFFDHHGRRIAVIFLNHNYVHRVDRETVDALVERARTADYTIAVTHQLDRALAPMLEGRVNLILAGHTHGGQINPFLGWRHVQLARLETEFVDGRYQLGSTTVIVTPGIGYSIVPIRYAAPGAIEILELTL